MNEKNGFLYKVVNLFENGDRSSRHNNYGAHIWTPELAEKFGARRGDPFTGSDGRIYNTAYYNDPDMGNQASNYVIDNIWKTSKGDTLKFATTYTGLPETDPTVQNYAQRINQSKSSQDLAGAKERLNNRNNLLKRKEDLYAEFPKQEKKIDKLVEEGRHSADGIRDELSKSIPKEDFDYEAFKSDVMTSLDISEDEVEGTKNAFIRGYGNLKTMINVLGYQLGINPEERVKQIAIEQSNLEDLPASESFERAMNPENDFSTTLKEIGSDPISVTTQLAVESLTQFLPVGVAVGLPLAVASTIVGAPVWLPIATASGIASLGIEWSSEILNSFGQQGVNVKNPDELASAFTNEEINAKAQQEALEKGVPIMVLDAISGGVAGRYIKMARGMGLTRNLTAIGKEILQQAGLGGAGEAIGQAVALDPEEGEQFNIPAIVAESIVEIGTGGVAGTVRLTFDNGNSIEVPEDDPLVQDIITAKTRQYQEPTTEVETEYAGRVSQLSKYKDQVGIGFSDLPIEDVFTEQRLIDIGYDPSQYEQQLIKEGEEGYVDDSVNRYRLPVRATNYEFGDGTRRVLLSKEADQSDFLEDTAEAVYSRMGSTNKELRADIDGWVVGVKNEAKLKGESLPFSGAELFSKSFLKSLGYDVPLPDYAVLPENLKDAFKGELALDDGRNLIDGFEVFDIMPEPTEAIDTTEITDFAKRIATGEELSTPEDLQFYENNKKDIEQALQELQEKPPTKVESAPQQELFSLGRPSTEEVFQNLKNKRPIIKAGQAVNVKDIPKIINRVETMAMRDIAKIFDSDSSISPILISPRRWYREGLNKAIEHTAEFAPDVYNKESYFITTLGILSNGQPVDTNYNQSVDVYMNTDENQIPFIEFTSDKGKSFQAFGGLSETGKPYGGVRAQTVSEHGIKLQKIINEYGIENIDKFLLGTFKAKDLKSKYGAMNYLTTNAELNSDVYGSMIFGNKIGSYIVNMHGIHENAVLDSWMFRTLARYTGLGKDSKSTPPKNAIIAMNKALSNVANRWTKITGIPWGVDQVQAVLWYNEKDQYIQSGVRPQEGTSYEEIAKTTARTVSTSEGTKVGTKDGVQRSDDTRKPATGRRSDVQRDSSRRGVTRQSESESYRSLGDARRFRSLTTSQAPDFLRAINQSKEQSKYGSSVFVYTLDEYKNIKLYMTDNGSMGFGIKPDGDIVSAFHNKSIDSNPFALQALMPFAISKGGIKLEAFDTVLPKAYAKFGFVEVGRDSWNDDHAPADWDKKTYKNFNKGEPDIVYMKLEDAPEGFSLGRAQEKEYAKAFNKKVTRKESRNERRNERLYKPHQIRDTFRTLSSQLNRIHPKITEKLRRFQKRHHDLFQIYLDATAPFAKTLKKIKKRARTRKAKAEWVALKLALYNGDTATVEAILKTKRRLKQYHTWQEAHESLHEKAMAVGVDMGHIENHFPREVTDPNAFFKYVSGITASAKRSKLQEAFQDAQDKKNRALTDEEKIAIANILMRQEKGLLTNKTNFAKNRKIDQLTVDQLRFYDEPYNSLARYASGMSKMVASAQFLGGRPNRYSVRTLPKTARIKGVGIYDNKVRKFLLNEKNGLLVFSSRKSPNVSRVMEELRKDEQARTGLPYMGLEDQVGSMILDLQAEFHLSEKQAERVQQLFSVYFKQDSMHPFFAGMRSFGYISTMGSVFSAVTQLGDLGVAIYRSGKGKTLGLLRPSTYTRVVSEMFKSITRLNKYKLKDLGVDNKILQELSDDQTPLQRTMAWVFTLSGLRMMDRVGKETYVNTVMKKYIKGAKQIRRGRNNKLTRDLNRRIKRKFNTTESAQLIEDLASGKKTELSLLLAYSELLDVQPVAQSEVPVGYLEHPNGRLFYMLKTFMLKRMDVFVNETAILKEEGKHASAIMNMVMLGTVLAMAEAGADSIKDWMAGRKTPLPELVWSNLLKLAGVSRYHYYNFINSKPSQAIIKMLVPPYDYIDDPITDLKYLHKRLDKYKNTRTPAKYAWEDFQKRGARWIRHIPLFGKHMYWMEKDGEWSKIIDRYAPFMSGGYGKRVMKERQKKERNK